MKFNYSQKKITPKEFAEFEKQFGFELPDDYKTLMLESNGGRPVRRYIGETLLDMFYSIKYGEFTFEKMYELIKDTIPEGYYPFALDGFGNDFVISLKPGSYGSVFFIPRDLDNNEMSFVAGSLEDFLAELSEEMD